MRWAWPARSGGRRPAASRIAEAEPIGFRRIIVPAASGAPLERADGLFHLMQVQEVEDIRQALSAVLGAEPCARPG